MLVCTASRRRRLLRACILSIHLLLLSFNYVIIVLFYFLIYHNYLLYLNDFLYNQFNFISYLHNQLYIFLYLEYEYEAIFKYVLGIN